MMKKFLALAAVMALAGGLAACGSDDMEGSLPPAKPAAAESPASGDMAAESMAAEETGGEMVTEEAATEEMVVEEVSPEGVETEETVAETVVTEETAMTEEEAPAPEETAEARLNARLMLREVRNGSYAIRYCQDIEDVTLTVFDDCVDAQLATAETDGDLTEAYKLGADYQAWVFLGEHAREIHEKGYEWTKEYRTIFRSRAKYQKSVQSLIYSTGLDEREVCAQLSGDC